MIGPLTWQDILLLLVASFIAVFVTFVAVRIIRTQSQLLAFAKQLKAEVGTDSGNTIAERFHAQDEALLRLTQAVEKSAETARSANLDTVANLETLRSLIAVMKQEADWQQKFNQLQAEALAKGITLSVVTTAAQQTQDIAKVVHSGRDSNTVENAGSIGQASAGSEAEQKQ